MKTPSPFLYSLYSLSLISALMIASCTPPNQLAKPQVQTQAKSPKEIKLLPDSPKNSNLQKTAKPQEGSQQFSIKDYFSAFNGNLDETMGYSLKMSYSVTDLITSYGMPPSEDLDFSTEFEPLAPDNSFKNFSIFRPVYGTNAQGDKIVTQFELTARFSHASEKKLGIFDNNEFIESWFTRSIYLVAKFESQDGKHFIPSPPEENGLPIGNTSFEYYNSLPYAIKVNGNNGHCYDYARSDFPNRVGNTERHVVVTGTIDVAPDPNNPSRHVLKTNLQLETAQDVGTNTDFWYNTYCPNRTWSDNLIFKSELKVNIPVDLLQDQFNLNLTEPAISPKNGDGQFDNTTFIIDTNAERNWTLRLRNSSGATVYETTGTGSLSRLWTSTTLPDGNYIAQLEDTQGNTSNPVQLTIDNTPPELESFVPVGTNADGSTQFEIKAKDPLVNGANSEMQNIELTLDGHSKTSLTLNGDSATYSGTITDPFLAAAIFGADFSTASVGDFKVQAKPLTTAGNYLLIDALGNKLQALIQLAAAIQQPVYSPLNKSCKNPFVKTGSGKNKKNNNKIKFINAYDFDRTQTVNSRDITLAFLTDNSNDEFIGNNFLKNIKVTSSSSTINNLKITSGGEIQKSGTKAYLAKFTNDQITDSLFNTTPKSRETDPFLINEYNNLSSEIKDKELVCELAAYHVA